jgi:hypothetical protein
MVVVAFVDILKLLKLVIMGTILQVELLQVLISLVFEGFQVIIVAFVNFL